MSDQKTPGAALSARPFIPERRYLEVSCDETSAFPGFWAEIAALTYEESAALSATQHITALIATMAPYVRRWNYRARDQATGEHRDLPAPAVAGPVVLTVIDQGLVMWLRQACMDAPLWQLPGKATTPTPPETTYDA